jgi:hypothetical protein
MIRSGFSQDRQAALEPKTCKHCPRQFIPRSSFATCCSQRCAMKEVKAKDKAEREQLKARKEAIKTIPDLIKEAQREFNAFCRERDRQAGYRCISSGRWLDWSGNGVDAGHYRSVGSAPHLRFDERNCHAQSKHDNQWKSGNAVDYRIGLIGRIGLEAVEALEADNRIHKWTREELIAIRATYKAKLKTLKEAA